MRVMNLRIEDMEPLTFEEPIMETRFGGRMPIEVLFERRARLGEPVGRALSNYGWAEAIDVAEADI
jgi:hypothetical protein